MPTAAASPPSSPRHKEEHMADVKKSVATPTDTFLAMDEKWAVIRALCGGTLAMRAAGSTYLPQETREAPADFQARLNRSFLFNGYRDSVDKLAAKPFSREVVLHGGDKLDEQLAGIAEDTDRAGTNLTALAAELFVMLINHGVAHLWVDYPRVGDEPPNVSIQRATGIRPTLIPVRPSDVIGWRSEVDETGSERLTQVRIRERQEQPSGLWDSVSVERIRVLKIAGWELYEYDGEVWKQIGAGTWTYTGGGVPFVTAYASREGFMQASPALEDLAWVNVAHWQSSSDQRNILRFARTGLIFTKGISQREIKEQGGVTFGPGAAIYAESPEADAKVVEHSGRAIEAGAKDLVALEQQMQVLGLQPFFRMTGGATATEKMIDEGRSESEIQAWIKIDEELIRAGYEVAAKWVGSKLPTGFAVDIYSDFIIGSMVGRDLELLRKARLRGALDSETFLAEVKRRGVFADSTDVEEIMKRIEKEGASLTGGGDFGATSEG